MGKQQKLFNKKLLGHWCTTLVMSFWMISEIIPIKSVRGQIFGEWEWGSEAMPHVRLGNHGLVRLRVCKDRNGFKNPARTTGWL